ncbi:MAG: hypothetical protein K2P70_12405 [Hyphomonadaceae bacterium]|nr:hypothetical protein [Hyphomonadaceae bacterium]
MRIDLERLIDELSRNAGDLWFLAVVGSFFVMVCEAAKPKPGEGESKAAPEGLPLLVMILSLITPLLLFFHAFLTASGALIAIIALIGGAIISSALIGWIIGAAAPDVGRTLNRAAPFLAIAVFALTAYVTWRTVFEFVNGIVTGRA